MRKTIVAGVAALAIGGCGELGALAEALRAGLDKGHVNALAYQLTSDLIELETISSGLSGLAGQQVQLNISIGAAPIAAAPGFRTLSTCVGSEGVDHTYEETKDDYGAGQEEARADMAITYRCVEGAMVVKKFEADIVYKDGGTGSILAVEEADGSQDGDLLTDFAEMTVVRNFPQKDARASITLHTLMNFGGGFDAPLPGRERTFKYAEATIKMRSGATIYQEANPTTPVAEGAEPESGMFTRELTFVGGPVTRRIEEVEIESAGKGTFEELTDFRDGTYSSRSAAIDGDRVKLEETRRNGVEKSGQLNLTTGDFSFQTTFPAGHEIFTITESGTWKKGAAKRSYSRRVSYNDPTREPEALDVEVSVQDGNTLRATFSYDAGDNYLTGDAAITREATRTTSRVTLENGLGDEVVVEEVRYPDGTAEQQYAKDYSSTQNVNPDETGQFAFAADGSGTGSVVVYAADYDVSESYVTYDVTIAADGAVQIRQVPN